MNEYEVNNEGALAAPGEEIELTPQEEAELEEEAAADETRRLGALISPAALIMFPVAILLDLFGVICVILYFVYGTGVILDFLPDIIGLIIITPWCFLHSQQVKAATPKLQAAKRVKKNVEKFEKRIAKSAKWAKRLKYLRPLFIIFEFIHVFGAGPWWTLTVYYELKT